MTTSLAIHPRYARARLESLPEEERKVELTSLGNQINQYVSSQPELSFQERLELVVRALAMHGHHLEEYDYDGHTHFYGRARQVSDNSDLCFRASEEDGVFVGWDDWTLPDD